MTGATYTGRLPDHAQVVVIGAGIVGCSVAYHLTRLGWTDVVILERRTLGSGTTGHGAGLVTQLRHTRAPHGPVALLRGPLPATRGRHRPAIGVQADRQHKRGADGGPHGRAEALRVHGQGFWGPDRRDQPPGGSRSVADDAHRRPRRRHIHPRRRADGSRPYDEGSRHGGDSARRGPARERESHGHRYEGRRRGRDHDRQGRYQVRDRGQLRRHVGQGRSV